MLKQLTIKNLAIIDDITIDFYNNFNVLTGETGAGKSIIIDAISLVFGARANSDMIQTNKESAMIFASLDVNEKVSKYILDNFDIDVSDEFIISRVLNINGKNISKINGIIVPLHIINQISNFLIDISLFTIISIKSPFYSKNPCQINNKDFLFIHHFLLHLTFC